MKYINIVFENDLSDVDLLYVPDYVADNIDQVVMEFDKWLRNPENGNRFLVPYNGKMVLGIGTEEFTWWLNNSKKEYNNSTIFKQHTTFCPEYPTANF